MVIQNHNPDEHHSRKKIDQISQNDCILSKIMANSIRYSHPVLSGVKIENKWSWDADSKSECVSLTADNRNAYFFDNPYTISRGTAGVRGNKPIGTGVHYFEVLVKEPLYGTAIMVGYGTEETKLHYDNFDYINLVGKDSNSWGLCHKGTIWHQGAFKKYCDPIFDKDSLIGVLLNMHDKTIHYFLNGCYLGMAFKNVNSDNKKLYPMISSTATDIEIEIVNSYMIVYSLQDLCCQTIINNNSKVFELDKLPLAKRLINYLKNYKKF